MDSQQNRQREGPQRRSPSPKRATIKKEAEVNNNESLSSAGLSDETLHDHRFTVYGRDSAAVDEVRARILGLEAETRPSRWDVDSSPIFALRRAADESQLPSIIGEHWVPYLISRIASLKISPIKMGGCPCTLGQA